DEISAEEAVKAYHGVLQKLGIRPQRPLDEDMQLTTNIMQYAADAKVVSTPPRVSQSGQAKAKKSCACGCGKCGDQETGERSATRAVAYAEPDFSKMTAGEKIAYHKARWDRILG